MQSQAPVLSITKKQFFTFKRDNEHLYEKLQHQRKIAEQTRKQIDEVYNEILADYTFTRKDTGEKITHHDDLWLTDGDLSEYYERTCKAVTDLGYDLPKGYCPAISAEHEVIKTENSLIKAVANMLKVDYTLMLSGKHRDRVLELIENTYS